MSNGEGMKTAVFGGGCFWCTEAVFQDLRGVRSVLPGYSGGTVPSPTYQQVCSETTGHAEVIEVQYEPKEVDYNDLLSVFFATHDPTTVDRQGNDVGSQYRSVIFYQDEEQRKEAEQAIEKLETEGTFGAPIVTQLEPLDVFYEAEGYHRNYFRNNPGQAYCSVIIAPKVAKFRQKNMDKLRG
ncbi:MAG: peptide-methionine (S)-S-oxide reductase MsrA [Trueperaceae bacterium]